MAPVQFPAVGHLRAGTRRLRASSGRRQGFKLSADRPLEGTRTHHAAV